MPVMTKRVNIRASVPVYNITPPIHGTIKNVVMTTGDILKCLCRRAIVDEILPDGRTVRLNIRNYYTDNGAGLYADVDEKNEAKEHKKTTKPKKETKAPAEPVKEEPVNEEQVVETENKDEEPLVSITVSGPALEIKEPEPVIFEEIKENPVEDILKTAPDLPAIDEVAAKLESPTEENSVEPEPAVEQSTPVKKATSSRNRSRKSSSSSKRSSTRKKTNSNT